MGLLAADGRALPLQLEGEAAPVGTDRVLVLAEAEQTFTFVGIDAPPVPSLLRGFSAPVLLDDGLDDADLLVLLQHDHDAFNRWEAGQRLALRRMLAALPDAGREPHLDDAFVDAMRACCARPSSTRPSRNWC
jgi:aminopeptidase N